MRAPRGYLQQHVDGPTLRLEVPRAYRDFIDLTCDRRTKSLRLSVALLKDAKVGAAMHVALQTDGRSYPARGRLEKYVGDYPDTFLQARYPEPKLLLESLRKGRWITLHMDKDIYSLPIGGLEILLPRFEADRTS